MYDAHLRIGIVLHTVVVAIEVVGGDVEQYGNVSAEIIHVVELEAAKFDDVVVIGLSFGYLKGE